MRGATDQADWGRPALGQRSGCKGPESTAQTLPPALSGQLSSSEPALICRTRLNSMSAPLSSASPVSSAASAGAAPVSRVSRAFPIGALWGAIGIALGAFGAHALADRFSPADLAIYETGVRYQMYAALALLALGAVGQGGWPARLLLIGSLIFSVSLYLLVGLGVRWLGAITPIGGVLMIAALVWVAALHWRR